MLNVEFRPAVGGSRMRGRFLISNWGGIAHAKDAKGAKDGRKPRPSRGR